MLHNHLLCTSKVDKFFLTIQIGTTMKIFMHLVHINSVIGYFDVVYENTEESGALTNYIPEGNLEGMPTNLATRMLIKLITNKIINLMVFDFIEGLTVKQLMEGLFFLVCQPFGKHLRAYLSDQTLKTMVFSSSLRFCY